MKTKFNIGEEVYFMKYDEPTKGIIKGYTITFGEFETIHFKRSGKDGIPVITYCIENYNTVDENKVFKTKQELQDSLFSKL